MHEDVFDIDVHYFKEKVDFVQVVTLKTKVKTNFSGTTRVIDRNSPWQPGIKSFGMPTSLHPLLLPTRTGPRFFKASPSITTQACFFILYDLAPIVAAGVHVHFILTGPKNLTFARKNIVFRIIVMQV